MIDYDIVFQEAVNRPWGREHLVVVRCKTGREHSFALTEQQLTYLDSMVQEQEEHLARVEDKEEPAEDVEQLRQEARIILEKLQRLDRRAYDELASAISETKLEAEK